MESPAVGWVDLGQMRCLARVGKSLEARFGATAGPERSEQKSAAIVQRSDESEATISTKSEEVSLASLRTRPSVENRFTDSHARVSIFNARERAGLASKVGADLG